MKRIVIYAYNEEMEDLKPLAEKLEKQGAAARFMNLKYDEPAKCDIALTAEKYVDRVKKIFDKFPDVEVKALDADLSKAIKDHNKGPAPRQGDSQKTAEAVEPTKKTASEAPPKADAPDVVVTAGEPERTAGQTVNPAEGADVTTIATKRVKK